MLRLFSYCFAAAVDSKSKYFKLNLALQRHLFLVFVVAFLAAVFSCCSKAAVLNLIRLVDHLTNFVSACGPPKKFLHFLGKISEFLNDLLKSFCLKKYSPFANHQKEFRQFSQFSLHFSGSRTEKIFKFSFAI